MNALETTSDNVEIFTGFIGNFVIVERCIIVEVYNIKTFSRCFAHTKRQSLLFTGLQLTKIVIEV